MLLQFMVLGWRKVRLGSACFRSKLINEAPTLAEIRLKLAENEEREGVESGVTSWLSNGIHIEEAQ